MIHAKSFELIWKHGLFVSGQGFRLLFVGAGYHEPWNIIVTAGSMAVAKSQLIVKGG